MPGSGRPQRWHDIEDEFMPVVTTKNAWITRHARQSMEICDVSSATLKQVIFT